VPVAGALAAATICADAAGPNDGRAKLGGWQPVRPVCLGNSTLGDSQHPLPVGMIRRIHYMGG
jgi:hypothetical protein